MRWLAPPDGGYHGERPAPAAYVGVEVEPTGRQRTRRTCLGRRLPAEREYTLAIIPADPPPSPHKPGSRAWTPTPPPLPPWIQRRWATSDEEANAIAARLLDEYNAGAREQAALHAQRRTIRGDR